MKIYPNASVFVYNCDNPYADVYLKFSELENNHFDPILQLWNHDGFAVELDFQNNTWKASSHTSTPIIVFNHDLYLFFHHDKDGGLSNNATVFTSRYAAEDQWLDTDKGWLRQGELIALRLDGTLQRFDMDDLADEYIRANR